MSETERRLRARRGSSFRPGSAPRRAHAHPRCLSAPRAARAVGPSVVRRPVATAAPGATRGSRRRGTPPDRTRALCLRLARGPAADRAEPSNFGEYGAGAAALPGSPASGAPGSAGFRLAGRPAGLDSLGNLLLFPPFPVSESSPPLSRSPACLRVPLSGVLLVREHPLLRRISI